MCSSEKLVSIRQMKLLDLPRVLEIQSTCYTEVAPESEASIVAKLRASPSSCFVACELGNVIGYVISLPWSFESPPELDALTCVLPQTPDTLYVHDLAVANSARKLGAGKALIETIVHYAQTINLNRLSLVAVQDSMRYWSRRGFREVPVSAALKTKLASYGLSASYMERVL